MNRLIPIIILSCIFLTGCVPTQIEPQIITKEVKVPVYLEKTFPHRELPVLPINKLTTDSSYQDTVKAYDNSIIILMDEVRIYRTMIYKESK